MFARLPWRRELLEGLLSYDLLGFQTRRDLSHFLDCVRALVPQATVLGWGGSSLRHLLFEGREIRAGWFPISIDFAEFDGLARSPEVSETAWHIHEQLPERTLVLGVDRLDYTKGLPERLKAMETFLERYPDLHGKVTLIQVTVPSREEVPEYQRMREELEGLVGRINGRFTREGWVPIHYIYRSLSRRELVAYYRTCEVALITPLKDGMNLVAKEYCAASVDGQGVLILSEFAGAAAQMASPSLIVNPHNTDQVAEALHRAITMPPSERADRIRRLRRHVREHDVAHWARDFGRAAGLGLREPQAPPLRREAR
jgi:trehalose 6-phosphate synthase